MHELAVRVPVLIVGGGPVGLAMAIGLRHFGVECLLVEGRESASDFPKGRAVNARSMEIFAQWGLAERVRAESMAEDPEAFGFLGETLLAAEFRRIPLAESVVTPWSTHQRVMCPQERVERVLREAADERGAELRFGHRCVSLEDRGDVVVAQVERRASASSVEIVADFVVAADGSRSLVRDGLGIAFEGPGVLGESVSILVDAPLGDRIADRTSVLYGVQRPRPGAGFAVVDNDHRWLLMMPRDVTAEPVEWFTPERCVELARSAIGDDSVPVEYVAHQLWRPTARWVTSMSVGRVFLAGDAAHSTTPAGGLGMNCGIADAHNLAWKLAWTLRGHAGSDLLSTYDAERRPAAQRTAEASIAIGVSIRNPGPRRVPLGVTLGIEYASSVIVRDRSAPGPADDPIHDYLPSARPGCRAPHVQLADGSSLLERFGDGFVAVVADGRTALESMAWSQGAGASVAVLPPVAADLYGIERGYVLVRPDGYVAAREPRCEDIVAGVGAALEEATGLAH